MTVLSFDAPPLAAIAAQQFRTRQAKAREMVRDRKVTEREATARLRPWLAIACLCGADLPELHELLADERIDQLYPDARGAAQAAVSESEARSLVARDICPRRDWIAALAAARDAALEHHHRLEQLASSRHPAEPGEVRAALANAVALTRIATALRVPPHQPRPAAARQVAA